MAKEYLEIGDKKYEVTGHADDGLPIIKGEATSLIHKDENGNQLYDEHGNPKISVGVNVPSSKLGIKPGEVS